MDHFNIWAKAKEEIRPQMTGMSYRAWIESLEPLCLQNHILVLEVKNDDIRSTLKQFYFDMLTDAVRHADETVLDLRLSLPEERERYLPAAAAAAPAGVYSDTLNPKYTFDSFIVGNSNQFAHAAARAVAQNPGSAYNPLFIYGGVGLGKTHLMHAIGHSVLSSSPSAKVVYVTSETFTNELITAIQEDKRREFQNRYRSVDVLMIDDVQFISRSQATQEEFFNTFNTLYNANKQIVISSDRPPKEINKLEERLCSRFLWGVTADIQTPDIETRVAILRNRAKSDNIAVDDSILSFLAENIQSNIRELEGSLNRIVVYARLKQQPLTLQLTKEALKDLIPTVEKHELTPGYIRETVASFYGVEDAAMDGARRDRQIVMPRQVSMYLCHSLLSMPYKPIALLFNRSDHTTAMNACEKVETLLKEDENFAGDMKKILSTISSTCACG